MRLHKSWNQSWNKSCQWPQTLPIQTVWPAPGTALAFSTRCVHPSTSYPLKGHTYKMPREVTKKLPTSWRNLSEVSFTISEVDLFSLGFLKSQVLRSNQEYHFLLQLNCSELHWLIMMDFNHLKWWGWGRNSQKAPNFTSKTIIGE